MKINTTLAIALLITGSSLYADQFYGHGPVTRQERREQRRQERKDRREERRERLETHKIAQ